MNAFADGLSIVCRIEIIEMKSYTVYLLGIQSLAIAFDYFVVLNFHFDKGEAMLNECEFGPIFIAFKWCKLKQVQPPIRNGKLNSYFIPKYFDSSSLSRSTSFMIQKSLKKQKKNQKQNLHLKTS